jgi:type IV pilus assembly protein PilE
MGYARSAAVKWAGGFTLAELLITLAVVAILMAIAVPSYQAQIRKSRRADAMNALATVQMAQEKYRASNPAYTTLATLGLANPYRSPDGYYDVSVTATSATNFTATAAAVSGKSQASDTGCASIVLTVTSGSIAQTPPACWNR